MQTLALILKSVQADLAPEGESYILIASAAEFSISVRGNWLREYTGCGGDYSPSATGRREDVHML